MSKFLDTAMMERTFLEFLLAIENTGCQYSDIFREFELETAFHSATGGNLIYETFMSTPR